MYISIDTKVYLIYMLKSTNTRCQVNIKLRDEVSRKVEHYNKLYPERPLKLAAICRDAAEKALEVVLERAYREAGIKELPITNNTSTFVKERQDSIKEIATMVAEIGSTNKENLVGKVAVETGLRADTIEGYISTLVDAKILTIEGDQVVFIEQDEVKLP